LQIYEALGQVFAFQGKKILKEKIGLAIPRPIIKNIVLILDLKKVKLANKILLTSYKKSIAPGLKY